VIRGGDRNRLVDAFIDGAFTAVGFDEVGDGRRTDRTQVIRALSVGGDEADASAAANRFSMFVSAISVGDAVLMPDPDRKEVVVGIVEGDYEFDGSVPAERYRHRRAVRWVGRHDRDDLPGGWVDTVMKQRLAIARQDAVALDQHVAAVVAGDIGRPARQRGRAAGRAAGRSSSSGVSRTPTPKAPARSLRTCPGCGFNLAVTVFDGEELCRDCRA
jgi:hypothetical protein